jgi:nitrite reductase/ring-hydroxylating ferredoxin subunit
MTAPTDLITHDGRSVPAPDTTASASNCPLRLDRRTFLRTASLAVAGSLVAAGLAPSDAFAGAVHDLTALASGGMERSYPVPATDGVWVDRDGNVAVARVGTHLFAFSLECPHRGRTLQWIPLEQRFYCAKHKARFTSDGAHASGRRTTELDRFAIRRTSAGVVVQLDQAFASDTNPSAWAAAELSL